MYLSLRHHPSYKKNSNVLSVLQASKDLILKDHEGKELKALDVFALSIEFLKNHCWTEIQIANNVIETEDVTWVLTVPAIWSERSKKFMREAAIKVSYDGVLLYFLNFLSIVVESIMVF